MDRIPEPPPPARGRGRPVVYSEKLFLKALLIMIVPRLHKVHELLSVLEEPTAEMQMLRSLLSEGEHFPSRRTFERRLKRLPERLPAQIACLGAHLVGLLRPWADCGRAVALDSMALRALGGEWHRRDREAGVVPHTSIDTEAGWLRSTAIENLNEHLKSIFDIHRPVPTRGLANTQRFALGAVFVYQVALLYRAEHGLDLNAGLKPFLRAA